MYNAGQLRDCCVNFRRDTQLVVTRITGTFYNMSIQLTTKVLSLPNLSQSEKHILTILCFRADQNNEAYSSIERLSQDCSCSIKTIERTIKAIEGQ